MPDTHMATIGLVRVAPTGKVYLSVTGDEQIKERLNFTTEHRISPIRLMGIPLVILLFRLIWLWRMLEDMVLNKLLRVCFLRRNNDLPLW